MLLLLWIQGNAVQNGTVGASLNLIDPTLLPQLSFQWLADGQEIAGATSANLLLSQAQVGRQVSLRVTRPDGQGGSLISESNTMGPVLNVNDAPLGTVQILGMPIEGQPLQASPQVTDPDGVGTWRYQWKADGLPIDGATASQYVPGAGQVGQIISVVLTYTDGGGQAERLVSAATAPVQNQNNPPNTDQVLKIGGLTWQGLTLTALPNVQDADGVGTLHWQWYADGSPIAGAQSNSLLLVPELAGRRIRLRGRYIDGGGTLETIWSDTSPAVVNLDDPLSGTVMVLGTPSVGQTLKVAATVQDPDGMGPLQYQWFANGQAIPGAQDPQLVVGAQLLGQTLQVRVAQTDLRGEWSSVTSQSTLPVSATAVNLAQRVTLSGSVIEGSQLTAQVEWVGGIGAPTTRYQWLVDGQPIAEATQAQLSLDATMVGKGISVQIWCTDAMGRVQSIASATSAPVADAPSAPLLRQALPDVQWSLDQALLIQADPNAFVDPDGQPLELSWRLKGGGSWPDWLTIGDDGLSLRALPGATRPGTWIVERVATDGVLSSIDEMVLTARPGVTEVRLQAGSPGLTGAQLFADLNGDRVLGQAESLPMFSDASGRLQGQVQASGVWMVQGGTWAEQGVSSPMTLLAPAGSSVINPLTTLYQNLLDLGVDRATAREYLIAGWQLPEQMDLLNLDPDLNPGSGAVAVFRAQAQLWLLAGISGLREQALATLARSMVTQGPGPVNLLAPSELHQILIQHPSWWNKSDAAQIETRLLQALDDLTWLDDTRSMADAMASALGRLSPIDLMAPDVLESNPVPSEIGVDINTPLWLRFNEAIQVGTADIALRLASTGQSVPITWRIDGAQLIVTPQAWLSKQTSYALVLGPASLKDMAGNVLPEQRIPFVSSAFDPVDRAPVLLDSLPSEGERNTSLTNAWVFRFDEAVHLGSTPLTLSTANGALVQTLAAGQVSFGNDNKTLSIMPPAGVQHGQSYVLEMPTGSLLDSDGNSIAATRISFQMIGVQGGLVGTPGDDLLQGDAQPNVLLPGLGNDTVIGGDGVDVVCLPRFLSAYTFSGTSGLAQAFQGEFNVRIEQVEILRFGQTFSTDIPIAQALSGAAQTQLAQLTDLYLAFFNRAPDVSGLEYWQRENFNGGRNFDRISRDFAWSNEAQAWFPKGSDDRLFVQSIYQNCFDRDPDAGGWNYWTAQLKALGTTDLNARGSFVGRLILGAYAATSGPEDRGLLSNKHDVAMHYVNRLSVDTTHAFEPSINQLLDLVGLSSATATKAVRVIDHVFEHSGVSLTGVMNDAGLLAQLWAS